MAQELGEGVRNIENSSPIDILEGQQHISSTYCLHKRLVAGQIYFCQLWHDICNRNLVLKVLIVSSTSNLQLPVKEVHGDIFIQGVEHGIGEITDGDTRTHHSHYDSTPVPHGNIDPQHGLVHHLIVIDVEVIYVGLVYGEVVPIVIGIVGIHMIGKGHIRVEVLFQDREPEDALSKKGIHVCLEFLPCHGLHGLIRRILKMLNDNRRLGQLQGQGNLGLEPCVKLQSLYLADSFQQLHGFLVEFISSKLTDKNNKKNKKNYSSNFDYCTFFHGCLS